MRLSIGQHAAKLVRARLLALALLAAPAAAFVSTDAQASVSIAVGFDALVKDADAVAVVTPQEAKSVWEGNRIVTYTRVKVDQGVAGDIGAGTDGWVRTLGGVVGKIGQLVDGEPVLTTGKPALLFLRKFKAGGTFEVSARGQGQYPVILDDVSKAKKVIRSSSAGMILPPRENAGTQADGATSEQAPNQSTASAAKSDASKARVLLAQEVIHDRPLDEVTREIGTAWKRLHPTPPPTK